MCLSFSDVLGIFRWETFPDPVWHDFKMHLPSEDLIIQETMPILAMESEIGLSAGFS